MTNPLTAKLQHFAELSAADRYALAGFGGEIKLVPPGGDLIRQGDRPTCAQLVLEGWACRYKLLPDGKRQIVGYLVPGDLSDVQVVVLRRMDHSIGALGPVKVALIAPDMLRGLTGGHPQIAVAFQWTALVDEATLRECVINVGCREPYERVAHLLCEMLTRMGQVGLVTSGRFALPLTQAEISEIVALTPVTVNRVLQRLRRAKLITLRDGELSILDAEQLMALSGFDPTYLSLRASPSRSVLY